MRNKLLCLSTVLALTVAQKVAANDIEPSKEFYTAPFTANTITIDGDLSEWGGASIIADPKFAIPKGSGAGGTYVLFEEYNGGTWTGPDDHTSAVQLVYDADNVYLGIVVTDDYHENAAQSAWNGDAVQIMIANAARSTQVALYNYALGGVEDALGEVILMNEAGPGGSEAVIVRDSAAKKTYYEIKLPVASLGLTSLTAGTQFGLGMCINDGDELTPGQRGWGGLGAHALVYSKSPGETALITLGSGEPTVEVLGVGAEFLLGGDLTDPENDGNEEAGPTDPSWNWQSVSSNIEPGFGGGEFSFNIFDNLLGGGNDKWCCDDPSPENPYWVAVEFVRPVSLTHFTISSANDAPERDPTRFQIQGSNDGLNYEPIYVRDSDESLWTDRLQVVKITLPAPSKLYRYVRYIVTETPGPLHQIGEIEYFGNYGGASVAYLSAINAAIETFSFRATDVDTSIVNVDSAKLVIDGQTVALTSKRTGSAVDYTYKPASPFLPRSEHTYSIEVKDNQGNTITSSGNFRTIGYALLTAAEKVTPDTSKPGFIWRVHQNGAFTATDNTRPVQQLAGLLGENFADPDAQGPALAPGKRGATANLPIEFEIPGVINFDQFAGSNGDFMPDDQMPGIPGLGETATDDGIAAEIIAYVELAAGMNTIIVNSDDGFRTTAGVVNDVFKTQFAGEFVGGRGATDTAFTVYALEAGVYPLRTIWYEGGGGANIEWKMQKADGTKYLLNDVDNGGPKTYRALSGGSPTAITFVTPGIDATGVSLNTAVSAIIAEGATAVDVNSVKLSVDGTQVNATATKSGSNISIQYQPAAFFASGSQHTASITYTAGGAARTETWSFTIENYQTLTKAHQAVSADKNQPGFIWRVFQNEAVIHTTLADTEKALAGELTLDGEKLENLAYTEAVGIAAGPGTVDGPLVRFVIPTVINMSQFEGESNGNFTPDDQMPGVPGLNGVDNGVDAEIITYVDLPAGLVVMGVNSDDGFRTQAGYINVPADGLVLGQFDGGRGASDTIFKFIVQEAGTYPFRTIWQEGDGGANIEWFTVKADGTKVLLNDRANGGYSAYRVGVAPSKPVSTNFSIAVARNAGQIEISWTESGVVLQESTDLKTWTDVATATSPYRPAVGARNSVYYRLKK